jgi:hypothetical protein
MSHTTGTTPTNNNNNSSAPNPNASSNASSSAESRQNHHLESLSANGIKTDDSHLQYQSNHMMLGGMGTPGVGALSEEDSEVPQSEKATERKPGRRKINIEFIDDKSRRHITFSKRKAGIMKKAYELSALTGTQVLLLVASETGHVYTFATPKLQPLITKPEGKNLIQTCLNAPDIPQIPTNPHGQPANTPQRRNVPAFTESPYPDPDMGSVMNSYAGTPSGGGSYLTGHQTSQMRGYAPSGGPPTGASTPMGAPRYAGQPDVQSMAGGSTPHGLYAYSSQSGAGSGYSGGPGLDQEYMMGGQYGAPSGAWHSGNGGQGQHMGHMGHPQQHGKMGQMSTEAQLQQLNNTTLPS